jgi:tRNA(Ile)-lysidine synthase TilS/MesJ
MDIEQIKQFARRLGQQAAQQSNQQISYGNNEYKQETLPMTEQHAPKVIGDANERFPSQASMLQELQKQSIISRKALQQKRQQETAQFMKKQEEEEAARATLQQAEQSQQQPQLQQSPQQQQQPQSPAQTATQLAEMFAQETVAKRQQAQQQQQ